MIKRLSFFLFLAFFLQINVFGQKFGFIDSEYILSKMPEYNQAQKELDKLAQSWQKEIEKLNSDIDKLYRDYKAEEILLTDEMKKEKKDFIALKEKEARDYQNKMFGYNGLLFLKRQDLIKPIQEKVFKATEKVSKIKKIQVMFDKSSGITMIYMNPMHDYTEEILEELGVIKKEEDKTYEDIKNN